MTDIVRKHIIFHGSVQGVGFRYYSEHKANQLRLTGWVKNLYNGDVEMEVQGAGNSNRGTGFISDGEKICPNQRYGCQEDGCRCRRAIFPHPLTVPRESRFPITDD